MSYLDRFRNAVTTPLRDTYDHARVGVACAMVRLRRVLGLGPYDDDYLYPEDEPLREELGTVLPRLAYTPPSRTSGTAKLALLLSAASVAGVVYFHVPKAHMWMDAVYLTGKSYFVSEKPKPAEDDTRPVARVRKSPPRIEVVLSPEKRNKIMAVMLAWLQKVRPSSPMDDQLAQIEVIRGVIGDKATDMARHGAFDYVDESDSDFPADITAACTAGRTDSPSLIINLGCAAPVGGHYSFAISYTKHVYEIQRLNADLRSDFRVSEDGVSVLKTADLDGDRKTVEVIQTWREGVDDDLSVRVQKLTSSGRWKRLLTFSGAPDGRMVVAQPSGRRAPSLFVVQASYNHSTWEIDSYDVFEYQCEQDYMRQTREFFTDGRVDTDALLGPDSPLGRVIASVDS